MVLERSTSGSQEKQNFRSDSGSSKLSKFQSAELNLWFNTRVHEQSDPGSKEQETSRYDNGSPESRYRATREQQDLGTEKRSNSGSTPQGLEAPCTRDYHAYKNEGRFSNLVEREQTLLSTDINICLSSSRTLCIIATKTVISFSIQPFNALAQSGSQPLQPANVSKQQTLNSHGTTLQLPTQMGNISARSVEPLWCKMLFPNPTFVYFHEQTCSASNVLSLCEPDSHSLSSCPVRGGHVRRTGCETVRNFLPSLRTKFGLILKFEVGNIHSPYILKFEVHQVHIPKFYVPELGTPIEWKLRNYLFSPTFGKQTVCFNLHTFQSVILCVMCISVCVHVNVHACVCVWCACAFIICVYACACVSVCMCM